MLLQLDEDKDNGFHPSVKQTDSDSAIWTMTSESCTGFNQNELAYAI